MPDPLFGPEIRLMLADEDTAGLRSLCEELHPATIVAALDEFTQEKIWSIITPPTFAFRRRSSSGARDVARPVRARANVPLQPRRATRIRQTARGDREFVRRVYLFMGHADRFDVAVVHQVAWRRPGDVSGIVIFFSIAKVLLF